MSRNLSYKIEVDDSSLVESVQTVNDLKDALDKVQSDQVVIDPDASGAEESIVTLNSLRQAISDAQAEANELDIASQEFAAANVRIDELKSQLSDASGGAEELGAGFADAGSQIDKVTGGAVSSLAAVFNATKQAVVGMNTLKVAIASTGIGLLVLAVVALGQAFTRSEDGQNKFAKIMATISTITGTFLDIVADLGELIIAVFENPKKALNAFGNLLKSQIVNRVEGLLELIPALGNAISLVFEGKFVEAATVAGDAVAKVTLGVDDFTNKIIDASQATADFINKQIEKDRIAQEAQDKIIKARELERQLTIDQAKQEVRIAELRTLSRDQERFTAEERADFIREAQKLNDGLIAQETELLELKRDALLLQGSLGKNTAEDNDAEAEAIAAVIRLQKKKQDADRQSLQQLNALNQQAIAKQQEVADAYTKYTQDRLTAARQLQDQEQEILQSSLDSQLSALDAELEAIRNNENLKGEELITAVKENNDRRLAVEDERLAAEIAANNLKYDRIIADTLASEVLLESEKQALVAGFRQQAAQEEAAFRQEQNQVRIQQEIALRQEEQDAINEFNQFIKEEFAEQDANEFEAQRTQQQERYDQQLADLQAFLDAGTISREQFNLTSQDLAAQNAEVLTDIARQQADNEKQIQKDIEAVKISAVQTGFQTISNLTELFAGKGEAAAKKAFELQKKISIAQTLIETYKGAQAAYAAGTLQGGPIFGAISAAAAVTAGLLNVKRIASQQFQGSSATASNTTAINGTTTIPTTGEPATPNFTLFGNPNDTTITSEDLQNRQGQPSVIRAYVSETDIVSTSARLSSIRNQSEL